MLDLEWIFEKILWMLAFFQDTAIFRINGEPISIMDSIISVTFIRMVLEFFFDHGMSGSVDDLDDEVYPWNDYDEIEDY